MQNKILKKGFTLIELMITISIIGILTSIAIGSFTFAKNKAKNSGLIIENQQYILAMAVYSESNNGYPPSSDGTLVGSNTFNCLGTGCVYGGVVITTSIANATKKTNKNVASALSGYISVSTSNTAKYSSIFIDNLEYRGTVYTCLTYAVNGKCSEPIIFFPIFGSSCPDGSVIAITDGAGSVCAENVKNPDSLAITASINETAGCTDENATNYDPNATVNDGTCEYDSGSGTDYDGVNYRYSSFDANLGGSFGNGWNGDNLYYNGTTGAYSYLNGGESCIYVYDYYGTTGSNGNNFCTASENYYDGTESRYSSNNNSLGGYYGNGWDGSGRYYNNSLGDFTFKDGTGNCITVDDYIEGNNIHYCDHNNEVSGCTDSTASNYNANATIDNGSCNYTFYSGNPFKYASADGRLSNNFGNGWDGNNLYYAKNKGIYAYLNGYGTCILIDDYNNGNNLSYCTSDVNNTPGCTDPTATNYNPLAIVDDGSCDYNVYGCTDPTAKNYNPAAEFNDGSCTYDTPGCTDPLANNYNPNATINNGSCTYDPYYDSDPYRYASSNNKLGGSFGNGWDGNNLYYNTTTGLYSHVNGTACISVDDFLMGNNISYCKNGGDIPGCTDQTATNYNSLATIDDGSCTYNILGCTNPSATNYNSLATTDDGSCMIYGCRDPLANNYNPQANYDGEACTYDP